MPFYARLNLNIQESKADFEVIFNGPTPVFVASFVPSYSHVYWDILTVNSL